MLIVCTWGGVLHLRSLQHAHNFLIHLEFVYLINNFSVLGFAPSVSSLGTLSFKLHSDLAQAHGGRKAWGYSSSTGVSLSQDSESAIAGSGEDWLENGTSRAQAAGHNKPREEQVTRPGWLRRTQEGTMEVISRDGTTAQIDPLRFCQWVLKEVKARGVTIHQPARATGVIQDSDGVLSRVRIQQGDDAESQTERKTLPTQTCTYRLHIY